MTTKKVTQCSLCPPSGGGCLSHGSEETRLVVLNRGTSTAWGYEALKQGLRRAPTFSGIRVLKF